LTSVLVVDLSSRRLKCLVGKFLYVSHLSDYGVLDTAGSFEIVHVKPETRQKEESEECEPLRPTMSLLPLYHPVNPFSDKYRKGRHNRLPKDPG
jgi:hypothetical protein